MNAYRWVCVGALSLIVTIDLISSGSPTRNFFGDALYHITVGGTAWWTIHSARKATVKTIEELRFQKDDNESS